MFLYLDTLRNFSDGLVIYVSSVSCVSCSKIFLTLLTHLTLLTGAIIFFNPSLTLMNLILQKSIIRFFPEIVNIPHILDILDIFLRLVYLTSLALLIFFVLVFHKILSYNGYSGKSELSCNSQFSCYP